MKIFVINLERDISKKKYMTRTLSLIGAEYEFIDAVDGDNLDFNPNKKIYPDFGRLLTKGEVGTIFSHRKALSLILERKLPYAVILEDDVVLGDKFSVFLNKHPEYPGDFDIILMGHHTADSRFKPTASSPFYRKLIDEFRLVRPCELALGAYGYIISLKGAEKLISEMDKMDRPADWFTGSDKVLNLYLVKNPIVLINDSMVSQSNLTSDRIKADEEYLKNILQSNSLIQLLKKMKVHKLKYKIKSLLKYLKPLRKYS